MAETPETIYKYFETALIYVLDKRERKKIAADAGISVQYLGQVLNPKDRKKASIKSQKKIAAAAGYSYEDFLALGQALVKADELGGRHILYRAGLKYHMDGMSSSQHTELIAQMPIDSGKVEDFLAGRDSLTEDEQRQLCSVFAKGSYEDFLRIGLNFVQMELTANNNVDAYKTLKPANKPKLNLIDGGEKARKIDPATATHDEIITQFKHKEWVRRINFMLLEIEDDPVHRETVERVVKAIADQIRAKQDKVNND
jgi:transcriptional regulator with XRE-family HTH domain